MKLQTFWKAVLAQDADAIREYFAEDAVINWHCTNERFTVEEYLRANCEYPGEWDGEIERIEQAGRRALDHGDAGVAHRQKLFVSCDFFSPDRGGQDHRAG